MDEQIVHRDDGLVDGCYQATFTYQGLEIVSRVDRALLDAVHPAFDLMLAEELKALKAAGVRAGLPIISSATGELMARSE